MNYKTRIMNCAFFSVVRTLNYFHIFHISSFLTCTIEINILFVTFHVRIAMPDSQRAETLKPLSHCHLCVEGYLKSFLCCHLRRWFKCRRNHGKYIVFDLKLLFNCRKCNYKILLKHLTV